MKYTLFSHRENLKPEARKLLQMLLATNKRLNTAYLHKEPFGQLWDYSREGWTRRFFENWRASLKWQRLRPFALNNKIRVLQRRAYGLRDEEHLRLKVLTCMLPPMFIVRLRRR